MDSVSLIFMSIMGCAVLAAVALFSYQRYRQPEPTILQKRLARLKELHQTLETRQQNPGRLDLSSLFKRSRYENEALWKLFEKYSFSRNLEKTLRQGGMKIAVDRFILSFLIVPVAIGAVGSLLFVSVLPLLGGMVFAGLFWMMARMRQKSRLNKFVTQMPDALNLMTSSLRAGHSFQSALSMVVNELPDPISTEFAAVIQDLNLGLPLKESLTKLVMNLDTVPDVRMFSTALLIQREAGGNLAEILDKLSYTIRERFKLKGQISALTGQSRLTGYVMGCAPVVLYIGLSILSPEYLKPLQADPMGVFALYAAGVMQILGFVVVRKIVDIRV